MLKLTLLSQVVEEKIAYAKDVDEYVDSEIDFFQQQLAALRRRILLRTLLQLQSQITSQRQKLDIIMNKTVDRRQQPSLVAKVNML